MLPLANSYELWRLAKKGGKRRDISLSKGRGLKYIDLKKSLETRGEGVFRPNFNSSWKRVRKWGEDLQRPSFQGEGNIGISRRQSLCDHKGEKGSRERGGKERAVLVGIGEKGDLTRAAEKEDETP